MTAFDGLPVRVALFFVAVGLPVAALVYTAARARGSSRLRAAFTAGGYAVLGSVGYWLWWERTASDGADSDEK